VMQDQQNRELHSLERLSSAPPASVAAQMFSTPPLRKTQPEIYEKLVQLYGDLLDLALQQRAYKVEHNIAESLHAIVDQLGLLKAGPRDIVDLHRTALKRKTAKANLLKAQAYVEEGRMRLIELMGYLVSYYRYQSLGVNPVGSSTNHQKSLSAEEPTYE
jgi:outer membrane protein TolC